ncbi:hypothetical protein NKH85_16990 [Mesorhizobium sp. M0924]|uniref:hypothetical protein n=1 Tax=unclassified Mesorhizobium TaxID=325217 RepID=UPI003336B85E
MTRIAHHLVKRAAIDGAKDHPMYLAHHSEHANIAIGMRRLIQKRGVSMNGSSLWTEAEDANCRELYPDYRALQKVLPHRTSKAIEVRCAKIGLARTLIAWTGQDQAKLRKLWKTASRKEIIDAFPNRTPKSIDRKAEKLNLLRPKPPYKASGDHLLDALRDECLRQRISMADLDHFSNGRRYFRNRGWIGSRGAYNYAVIVRGIYALGGSLKVDWNEQ